MAKRANGTGGLVRLRYKDAVTGEVKLSRYWYILYRVGGRRIRESSESESKMVAEQLLQRRLGEHGMGLRPAQDTKNVKYKEVRDSYVEECRNKGRTFFVRASGEEYINGLRHVDDFFMGVRIADITSDMIRKFIERRRKEGAADPTIRRNLIILRAMMNLARKEGKLVAVPFFPMPQDSEPAGEYVPPEKFTQLLAALPENLHPFFTFMYATGCRLGAARQITWDMVSADCSEIKLPASIMKARQPLTLVLDGPVLGPVAAALRKMFRTEGPVFDSANYRPAWSKACAKVGLGTYDKKTRTRTGVRIHDCRCSAAVNLIDAGVDEDIVMKIGGWKTRAMFSRYNVLNTKRVREAMIRGGQYVTERAKKQA